MQNIRNYQVPPLLLVLVSLMNTYRVNGRPSGTPLAWILNRTLDRLLVAVGKGLTVGLQGKQ